MYKNRLLITEDEKKYILSMYGIIKENNQGNPEKLTITGSSFFETGKYSKLTDEGVLDLTNELGDALKFMIENEGKTTSIKILASEDSDRNYDREKDPTGKKSNDFFLDPGVLARKRAETMKTFLTNFFQNEIKNGRLKTMPIFEEPEIIIGTGQTPEQKKFDRRVEISFSIISESTTTTATTSSETCSKNLKIKIFYNEGSHGDHDCNSAIFKVFINDIPVNRDDGASYVSLNNIGALDNAGYRMQNKPLLVYTDDRKKKKENKIYKFPISNNPGGPRENYITIDSEKYASIPLIDNKVSVSLQCKNLNAFIPTPNDLNKYFPEVDKWPNGVNDWFTAKVPNGILYHGVDLTYNNNDGFWYHNEFKQNCHTSVGGIEFTNEKGKKRTFKIATPSSASSPPTKIITINPCTLEEINDD